MQNVLGDLTMKFVKVYLDDIIIHSPNVCSHMYHVHKVLKQLHQYHLFLKL